MKRKLEIHDTEINTIVDRGFIDVSFEWRLD